MNKLRELRLEHKIKLKDMATLVGLSPSFYYQVEKGSRKLSYENAYKIARVFDLKPDQLFYETYKNQS